MSRWKTQFENHAFQQTWSNLKSDLDIAKVDDKSMLTSVEELARLKKVVAYISGLLNNLDPELVPQATWDSFQQQSLECLTQVKNYTQTRNITYLQNANLNADNLLNYVRPYVVAYGKAAKAASDAYKTYVDEIKKYTESFLIKSDEIVSGITEANAVISVKLEDVISKAASIDGAFLDVCGDGGKESKIESIFEKINSKYSEINDLYERLIEGSEDEDAISDQIKEAKAEANRLLVQITTADKTISGVIQDLEDAHEKVYGLKDDSGIFVGGVKTEFEAHVRKYEALNTKVEDLLPGATSAALASSYDEMKVSFDTPIKNATNLFYGSIAALIAVSLILSFDLTIYPSISMSLIRPDNWISVLQGLAFKLPFLAPVIWLAYFASKRRSEYERLQQEYSHKKALATSFESYKKQIVELGEKNNPLLSLLLQKAVDAVAYNASESLDKKHGDKMPLQEVVEKAIDGVIKSKELVSFLNPK